jgi:hypothetical protein
MATPKSGFGDYIAAGMMGIDYSLPMSQPARGAIAG